MKKKDLERYIQEGVIEYIGELDDVRPALASCHAFVLPSYHEGRPRTIQEALAIGRFVVTTDAPGCRDAVEDGVTGALVPARDAAALASCLCKLILAADSWADKPEVYRRYAELRYDSEAISRQIFELISD